MTRHTHPHTATHINDAYVVSITVRRKMTSKTGRDKIGILTKEQRKYLRGESEIEEKSNTERAMRTRIRDRFQGALYDLELLNASLEQRDRNLALEELDEEGTTPPYSHIFTQMLELMFKGAMDPDVDIDVFSDQERDLTEMIEIPLNMALFDRDEDVVGVTIDLEIERVEDHAKSGGLDLVQKSERELKRMLAYDQITSEQFIETMEAKNDEESTDDESGERQ